MVWNTLFLHDASRFLMIWKNFCIDHICLAFYPECVSKFLGTEWFTQITKFQFNLVKKICRPAADSILMPPTFPIASLNRYTPNFSGVLQKLTWCQQFGLQIFPKWGDAHIWRLEMAVFRCFFGRNKFSRPNGRLSPIACHTYLESYDTQL